MLLKHTLFKKAMDDLKNIRISAETSVIADSIKEKYHFQTKLLGNHNVYNILAGIACGVEFGIEIEELYHR